jgi:hypothetical protein
MFCTLGHFWLYFQASEAGCPATSKLVDPRNRIQVKKSPPRNRIQVKIPPPPRNRIQETPPPPTITHEIRQICPHVSCVDLLYPLDPVFPHQSAESCCLKFAPSGFPVCSCWLLSGPTPFTCWSFRVLSSAVTVTTHWP